MDFLHHETFAKLIFKYFKACIVYQQAVVFVSAFVGISLHLLVQYSHL